MALSLNQQQALIFRITHRDNLPWILDNGLHARNSGIADPNFRAIGNPDLINKRAARRVPVAPGGVLTDYIPFYFTPHSIMMLNIHTGVSVPRVPNDEILIFVSSLHRLQEQGVRFVFANQHAYPVTAEFFNDTADLNQVDWALLQSRDFKHDPEDPGKKERYQAEALPWWHVPIGALDGVTCYSHKTEQQIKSEIQKRGLALKTGVQSNWYF